MTIIYNNKKRMGNYSKEKEQQSHRTVIEWNCYHACALFYQVAGIEDHKNSNDKRKGERERMMRELTTGNGELISKDRCSVRAEIKKKGMCRS